MLGLFRERGRADAELRGTGRDIDEFELALGFDSGTWTHVGDADDFRMSAERAEIISHLRMTGAPTKPADVAEALNRTPEATRKLMWTMSNQGDLHALGDGNYVLPDAGNTGNTSNAPVTSVTALEQSPDGDGP